MNTTPVTLLDIVNSWLDEQRVLDECDWIAHKIGVDIALKPRMTAMPYPICVAEKHIKYFNWEYAWSRHNNIWHVVKLDVSSPEFFNVLLTVIKNKIKHTCNDECGTSTYGFSSIL